MKIEEKIVSDLAYKLKQKLVKDVILELKNNPVKSKDNDKLCIENLWEEYCVSIQDKHSEVEDKDYKEDFINIFENKFLDLVLYERVTVWLKTADGIDWLYDKKNNSCELDLVPYSFEECKDNFYSMIYDIASEYDNDNIYRCVYMGCDKFRDNYSEDDKEQVYE